MLNTTEEKLSYTKRMLVKFRNDLDLYIFWRNVYNSLKGCKQ